MESGDAPADGEDAHVERARAVSSGKRTQLHALAKDQHWLVTFEQLLDIGFSRAAIRRMVLNGLMSS
jgi:hypothetical protein